MAASSVDVACGTTPSSLVTPPPSLSKDSFPLFRHQVAGHFPLLWREQAIYKPVQPSEAEFYHNMKTWFPALVPYTPKFYGVVNLVDDKTPSASNEPSAAGAATDGAAVPAPVKTLEIEPVPVPPSAPCPPAAVSVKDEIDSAMLPGSQPSNADDSLSAKSSSAALVRSTSSSSALSRSIRQAAAANSAATIASATSSSSAVASAPSIGIAAAPAVAVVPTIKSTTNAALASSSAALLVPTTVLNPSSSSSLSVSAPIAIPQPRTRAGSLTSSNSSSNAGAAAAVATNISNTTSTAAAVSGSSAIPIIKAPALPLPQQKHQDAGGPCPTSPALPATPIDGAFEDADVANVSGRVGATPTQSSGSSSISVPSSAAEKMASSATAVLDHHDESDCLLCRDEPSQHQHQKVATTKQHVRSHQHHHHHRHHHHTNRESSSSAAITSSSHEDAVDVEDRFVVEDDDDERAVMTASRSRDDDDDEHFMPDALQFSPPFRTTSASTQSSKSQQQSSSALKIRVTESPLPGAFSSVQSSLDDSSSSYCLTSNCSRRGGLSHHHHHNHHHHHQHGQHRVRIHEPLPSRFPELEDSESMSSSSMDSLSSSSAASAASLLMPPPSVESMHCSILHSRHSSVSEPPISPPPSLLCSPSMFPLSPPASLPQFMAVPASATSVSVSTSSATSNVPTSFIPSDSTETPSSSSSSPVLLAMPAPNSIPQPSNTPSTSAASSPAVTSASVVASSASVAPLSLPASVTSTSSSASALTAAVKAAAQPSSPKPSSPLPPLPSSFQPDSIDSTSASSSSALHVGTPVTSASADESNGGSSAASHQTPQTPLAATPANRNSTGSDWSHRLAQTTEKKKKKVTNQYLVLEDLTSQYKQPCILDLKLGVRQHGLKDTPAKIKSKMDKVKKSTSASLGLRLCGMQVYHPTEREFQFRDKYHGRQIDTVEFENTLVEYLHNRVHFREDLIPLFVERLEAFKKVIGLQSEYRFYSSSLLMLYEGDVPSDFDPSSSLQSIHSRIDVRFIDFAHAARTPAEESGLLDCGLLMGLQNLIHLLMKVYHAHARFPFRTFPIISLLRLCPDEADQRAGMRLTDMESDGADQLSTINSTVLPSILVGVRKPHRSATSNELSAEPIVNQSDISPPLPPRQQQQQHSDDASASNSESFRRSISLPICGRVPVDVLEMSVTPRGKITSQRLIRAADLASIEINL